MCHTGTNTGKQHSKTKINQRKHNKRILSILTCHFLRTMNFFNFSVGNAILLIASACCAIQGCSKHCLADIRNL